MDRPFEYRIEMLSDWHIGSGLDSATDANALVLKDERDLPYIPGKTIKGLLRDALNDMLDAGASDENDMLDAEDSAKNPVREELIQKIFEGLPDKKPKMGTAFFSNAVLPKEDAKAIEAYGLSDFLYRKIASTAIDKNGVAKHQSLRVIEVTMPLSLKGTIEGLETEEEMKLMKAALKWVRHLGLNRNRGLGRCKFIYSETSHT